MPSLTLTAPLSTVWQKRLAELARQLQGELHYDLTHRTLYATDASAYREIPLCVVLPKNTADIQQVIQFAQQYKVGIIPRTAGTSLAGQCVGNGIVLDVSKYLNQIIELNATENWVRVQPGVIQDYLNAFLKPHNLLFGPNTSTGNRCMIGGMIGNNSCGSYSIVYGTTRDQLLEVKALLSDGTEVVFKNTSNEEFRRKCIGNTLENELYRHIAQELNNPLQQAEIRRQFPNPHIHRRNTGYAVDVLVTQKPFNAAGAPFNFCSLIAGSEGTLAIITEAKLQLHPLPPPEMVLLCAHFKTLSQALEATVIAMQHQPRAVELIDNIIMDCTKENIEQQKNRFFIDGEPEAILVIEFAANTQNEVVQLAKNLENEFKINKLGYHFPLVYPPQTQQVWDLRKAGLGLLSNIKGDQRPVEGVEDTAVSVQDLPNYIAEFKQNLQKHGLYSVYFAHAGAGELHLRPILNLKNETDRQLFRTVVKETAELVKKYNGSLSGEHGDGRLRAEFIPIMIGEKNYQLLKRLKYTWDKNNIFNPNKIVDTPPMNEFLRYENNQENPTIDTVFDFSDTEGILIAAEKCNGSGDCRKTPQSAGGTMCPSYMATLNEKDTTRARANMLREFLTRSSQQNRFNHPELYQVMDLCISCKGCKSECPSNVDMATLKAEFLHQYHQANGIPLRSKVFAHINTLNKIGATMPAITNFFLQNSLTSGLFKKMVGIAPQRTMPLLHHISLKKWVAQKQPKPQGKTLGKVYLFADEFTNYNDTTIGIQAIELLTQLGYEVIIPAHTESGRAAISKGVLLHAQQCAIKNVQSLHPLITAQSPLIGIEPSAILTFKDEYLKLVPQNLKKQATELAAHCLTFEQFIMQAVEKKQISPEQFTTQKQYIKLHAHCHQKAITGTQATAQMLSLPLNYTVEVIPSGCCGMAGSFGYEAEHYEVSKKIGELVLFNAVKQSPDAAIIAAAGTSCRHQIMDFTAKKALHPITILYQAFTQKN